MKINITYKLFFTDCIQTSINILKKMYFFSYFRYTENSYEDVDIFEQISFWECVEDCDELEPWIISKIIKRNLYKFIFVREFIRKRDSWDERKNKPYVEFWEQYVSYGGDFPIEEYGIKKKIQVNPWIRYYIYLPYFEHISSKKFITINKKFRKSPYSVLGCNMQISNLELKTCNLLSKINMCVNKKFALDLIFQKAVCVHNAADINFIKKELGAYKAVYKNFVKKFNWKNNFFLFNNQIEFDQKKKIQKKAAISINADFKKQKTRFFFSVQYQKYFVNDFDKNMYSYIFYMKNHFFCKNLLNNDKMSQKYWSSISLLKNKIRYNVE